MESYLEVNALGTILEVGGDWDEFAEANDGHKCRSNHLVGTQLFSYVSGDQTKLWLDLLFQRAFALESEVKRTYRCDAPGMRRVFEMSISRCSGSALRLTHRLITQNRIGPHVRFETVPFGESDTARCSSCNSFRYNDEWRDVVDVSNHGIISVHYSICPSCMPMSTGKEKHSALAR